MTTRLLSIFFACFALVAASSCSDDDTEIAEQTSTSLSTDLSVVNCDVDGSAVSFTLNWNATTWSIQTEAGKIVAEITPATGGSATTSGSTEIKVEINPNTTGQVRTQSLVITDNVGAVKRVLLRQDVASNQVAVVTIDAATTCQHVAGFGAMYNPYVWTGSDMPSLDEIEYCYSPEGLGYTIMRLMVYTEKYQWSHDVDAAKLAQSHGAIIFASPWHCNDKWRDNVTVNGNTYKHLKHENYADYADHLVNYITYMKENGVNIYALSVQNEPDGEFTYWTASEIYDFVTEYGPKIRATGVKLMAPECMGIVKSYTEPLLSGVAFDNTDIVAAHTYTGFNDGAVDNDYRCERRAYIAQVWENVLNPVNKEWWMTEHLFNDGDGSEKTSDQLYGQWNYCLENLAREIHNCMITYSSAYLYWYLRRRTGLLGSNETNSPVPAGQVTANGYIMAHYSLYASNTTRIAAASTNDNVYASAYVDASGVVTVVAINFGDVAVDCKLTGVDASSATAIFSDEEYKMVDLKCTTDAGCTSILLNPRSITSIRFK